MITDGSVLLIALCVSAQYKAVYNNAIIQNWRSRQKKAYFSEYWEYRLSRYIDDCHFESTVTGFDKRYDEPDGWNKKLRQ